MRSIEEFLLRSRAAGADDLGALARAGAPMLGATDAVIYLIDYSRTRLVPLAGPSGAEYAELGISGTVAGHCFRTGTAVRGPGDHRCWLPLTDGGRRLGVLSVIGGSPDLIMGRRLADVLALLLTSRQSYSDLVERARRRQPMQLAAEVVWNLLPPVIVHTPALTVSGVLEPCYAVGGDAFDYSVNNELAHWAIFDAMGHGLPASLQATVAVNGYRNARRGGLPLLETYRHVDAAVRTTHPNAFVTALLAELDVRTGQLSYIAAGHPPAMVLREAKLQRTLASPTAMPLGLGDTPPPQADRRPGARRDAAPRRPGAQLHRRSGGGARSHRRVLRLGPAGRLRRPGAAGRLVSSGDAAAAHPRDPRLPARHAPGRRGRAAGALAPDRVKTAGAGPEVFTFGSRYLTVNLWSSNCWTLLSLAE